MSGRWPGAAPGGCGYEFRRVCNALATAPVESGCGICSGSSSAPGSRLKLAHPLAGEDLTDTAQG